MKATTILTLFGLFASINLSAQSLTQQILNKEQFLSAASLTQDYDNDGDLDIIASRWSPAGIYVLENDSTKQFPAIPIITENLSFYIADIDAADFDNDGDLDYVVCFTGVDDGELAWFQRQSDGTYIKWTIATNKDFIMADVGDFDGDGLIDIVAVGLINSDQRGRLYLNQGNLFFTEQIIATNRIWESVDAEDIDNDGDLDIAFGGSGSNFAEEDEGARLLLNDGNGNFTIGALLHCWTDNNNDCGGNENIQIVDLNSDGVKDILAFSLTGTGGLYWLDGSDGFDQLKIDDDNTIDLGGHFVVFDIDENGLLDIVRQSKNRDRVSVLYQMAPLQFTREYIEFNWDHCCNPTTKMSVGDLDNDGDLDLVFPEQGNVDHDFSWFENINGKLFKHQIYGELDGVRIPKMVDWDNDGDLDIFATVASGTIDDTEDELILYENIDGENFINWRLNDALNYAADVEFADIDGDGDLDAFATARDADDLVWLRNDGFQANWVTDIIFPEGNSPLGIATDDLDNDGDADVVMCSFNDDKVFGFLNDGNGNFSPIVIDANIDAPREVEIADFDNDGDKDVAVVSTSVSNTLVLYLNDGGGGFSEQLLFEGKSARDIEVGDWDGDGGIDIFISLYSSSPSEPLQDVIAFFNEGDANFITDPHLVNAEKTLGIRLGDLDGDGDLDLALGFDGSSQLIAVLNNGNGNALDIIPLSGIGGGTVHGVDIGDINNDGTNDIVYADFERDDLILLTIGCLVALSPSISITDATCNENNGTANIDVSLFNNPSIEWSNGATTAEVANLEPGDYEVTITDSNGCTASESIVIGSTPPAEIEIEGINPTCGNTNGSAIVNIISGAAVEYQWSNGKTSQSILNIGPGEYDVTVTDSTGCAITQSIIIEDIPVVEIETDITDATCGDANGVAAISIISGEVDSYEWNTGETTSTLTGIGAGSYDVTVTDINGCSVIQNVMVQAIPVAQIEVEITNTTCGEANGTATTIVNSGEVLSYEWSNGSTAAMITDLEPGTYDVTATDINGCEIIETLLLEATPIAEIEVEATNTTCGNEDGAVSVNILSGNILNYSWSNGQNTAMITGLPGGTYSVTVTDENDCEITQSTEVQGLTNPSVDLGEDITIEEGQIATLDASGSGLSYEWSTGANTPTIDVMESGVYSVTVTNSDGCTASDEILVNVITNTNSLSTENRIKLFPNPTSGRVFVSVASGEIDLYGYEVFDPNGKKIKEANINLSDQSFEISLEGFPNGLYLIRFFTNEGSQVSKRVIKNQ
ncbi:T9SS type A sorting domain-containing protein [Phaeodactylibacter xiamenensis]|uniref:T9SS type A sorting domain-containing protein n=1 Tax=Phaeodactylibacter xiamenensis TaxID=1524460 RepID=UPI0024A90A2D|nr:FG-GAP-like repeat-containing protein [Phaeodactylibacter xiamenensis]